MNNINRNNYETFFLLYADNELPAAEKRAVDEFVDANPDLQEELVMLQQSILKPDNIVFDDKESLLKNEFIPTRMQELLLLHLDNEQTEAERNETGGLIKSDAEIKKEWDVLKQTKLLPVSAIVFKDKRSLYRKEGGRIIAFPWRRVAAAAVFIGLAAWGGMVYFNKGAIVVNNEITIKPQPKQIHDTVKHGLEQSIAQVAPSIVKEKAVQTTRVKTKKPFATATIGSHQKATPGSRARNDQAVVIEKNNNLPKPHFENLNRIDRNETVPADVTHEKETPRNSDKVRSNDKQDPVNEYASTTSLTDNSEENENRILFMGEEKIKKTKLGGFFRKVKRVVERSTNIKPGDNNIKVANLEFAFQ